jgi:translocator protein
MKRFMAVINILAALAALSVNILANALPLNGQNTGTISDKFHVFFVPAGYVFAIWGVIYVGWIAFVVFQALPSQRDNPRLEKIGWLFALSCAANGLWLFAWHYEFFPLTVVLMLLLLSTLLAIYVRLNINRAQVSTLEKWTVDVPFGIYLGWISVATIANITDLLYYSKWDGWGLAPELWAVIMLTITLGIALAMALIRADVAYLLVLVWAFAGIAVKQSATPLVANAAWVSTVLVLLMVPMGLFYRRKATLSAKA